MTVIARTVNEARDMILKRLNAYGFSEYESMVLDMLNDSLVFVSTLHDWEYLRAKSTINVISSDGTIMLPEDMDRILAIHKAGSDYILTKLAPVDMEKAREDENVDEPMFYCPVGYSQPDAAKPPRLTIEILAHPSVGTSFTLWYIKMVDELVADGNPPNLPPHIFDMAIRKTILEGLKMVDAPGTTVQLEERHFIMLVDRYKKRESYGSSKYSEIKQRPEIINWYAKRMA